MFSNNETFKYQFVILLVKEGLKKDGYFNSKAGEYFFQEFF